MCIRRIVARRILKHFGVTHVNKMEGVISSLLRRQPVCKEQRPSDNCYVLPRAHFNAALSAESSVNAAPVSDDIPHPPDVTIQENGDTIMAAVSPGVVTQVVVSSSHPQTSGKFGTTYRVTKHGRFLAEPAYLNVAIEYSSPNIAKPFHIGHLRSTVLGNTLSNLYEARGHRVTRLNWLGDWGTQFGLLILGYTRYGDGELLRSNALRHLFEVYVKINGDVAREKGEGREDASDTYQEALSVFSKLERGDEKYKQLWETFKQSSLPELHQLYRRLGVHFDEVGSESTSIDKSRRLIDEWMKGGNIYLDRQTGLHCLDIDKGEHRVQVPLLKSDGSTLYLTRDLATILDRKERLNFDKIHYVVEKGQRDHFLTLTAALSSLGYSWIHGMKDEFHVPFGRVEGMRTRTGDVVLLTDLLDEGRSKMADIMAAKYTTKVQGNLDDVADCLSVSSVVVQEFAKPRNHNYVFSWNKALSFKSDSGVFLQYAHARLCSLQENCGVRLHDQIDHECLTEPEAQRVILELDRFDEVTRDALYSLEPHIFVRYLFQLTHYTNVALKKLPVKGQQTDIAEARLRMFCTSRDTLGYGLCLLGLTPLRKM